MKRASFLETPLLDWWFEGTLKQKQDRWFQSDIQKRKALDGQMERQFGSLLRNLMKFTYKLSEAQEFDVAEDIYLPLTQMEQILFLDQLSRHIFKGDSVLIDACTLVAADIAIEMLRNLGADQTICHERLVFLLMPLKHLDPLLNFDFIMFNLKKFNYTKSPQLMRFYKDLLRKYSPLESARQASFVRSDLPISSAHFSEITEFLPEDFARITCNYDGFVAKNALVGVILVKLCELKAKGELNLVTVSLSGGVDSMVILHILASYREEFRFRVQAYHYNARNRSESDQEEQFVRWYCQRLQVPLCVRVISEISRRANDREFYEEHTKNIRFDMYRRISGGDSSNLVVLGHIYDDTVENIWTNLARGRDLFNLKKMREFDHQNGITLWRPFLEQKKEAILQYSRENSIAYLLNTTPEWSNRGKFRTEFKPAVEKQFGPAIHETLVSVAETLQSYSGYLRATLFEPFLKSVRTYDFGFVIPISSRIHGSLPLDFWITVFTELFHPLNITLPSRASLSGFLKALNSGKSRVVTLKFDLYSVLEVRNQGQENPDGQVMFYIFYRDYISSHFGCDGYRLGMQDWPKIKGAAFME